MLAPRTAIKLLSIFLLLLSTLFFLSTISSVRAGTSTANVLLTSDRPDGDIDQNGKEDIFDLLALLKVIAGSSSSDVSDVDNNGKTDIFDLLALLKVLSGYYDKPPEITAIYNGQIIESGDSLTALDTVGISISYKNRIDSTTVEVNGEKTTGELNFTETGTYEIQIKAFGNVQVTELNFKCYILAAVIIKGQHIDNDTELGTKALMTIDGEEYETDIEGYFEMRIAQKTSYKIIATQVDEDNNPTGYRRTKTIPGMDNDTLRIYSVSYPTTCSATEFIEFAEEANFADWYLLYRGLKSMLRNQEAEFWISSHGSSLIFDSEGATATREDQEHVKNMIETQIYPYIKPQFRPKIYLENPDSLEEIPLFEYGKISVIPVDGGFGVGHKDENKDGIIDNSRVYLTEGWYRKESNQSQVFEELLSSLISANDVDIATETGLHIEGEITEKDKKLINMIQRYEPLEKIENILGL